MDVYAQRQGGTTNAYRFIFDGNRIVETQTPDDVRTPPATVTHSATAACSSTPGPSPRWLPRRIFRAHSKLRLSPPRLSPCSL